MWARNTQGEVGLTRCFCKDGGTWLDSFRRSEGPLHLTTSDFCFIQAQYVRVHSLAQSPRLLVRSYYNVALQSPNSC